MQIRRLSGFLTRATQIILYAYVIRYAEKMFSRKYRGVLLRCHSPRSFDTRKLSKYIPARSASVSPLIGIRTFFLFFFLLFALNYTHIHIVGTHARFELIFRFDAILLSRMTQEKKKDRLAEEKVERHDRAILRMILRFFLSALVSISNVVENVQLFPLALQNFYGLLLQSSRSARRFSPSERKDLERRC